VHKSILFLSIFVINTAFGQNSKSKDTVLEKEKSITLKQIVVEGKKPPITFKVDKQVFKASQFSNASNGTGIDVIRNLPSVSVNGQGEISFRGSSSFLVLINGKPTQGDASMILSQLSAASIENIEIITNPYNDKTLASAPIKIEKTNEMELKPLTRRKIFSIRPYI
jgi:hypothetical protein